DQGEAAATVRRHGVPFRKGGTDTRFVLAYYSTSTGFGQITRALVSPRRSISHRCFNPRQCRGFGPWINGRRICGLEAPPESRWSCRAIRLIKHISIVE